MTAVAWNTFAQSASRPSVAFQWAGEKASSNQLPVSTLSRSALQLLTHVALCVLYAFVPDKSLAARGAPSHSPAAAIMFNVFRLLADLSHVVAIVLLLLKITKTKSVAGTPCQRRPRAAPPVSANRRRSPCVRPDLSGISLKSQALFALVFCTRYVDLFWNFVSMYNTVMKIIFITTSLYTCYLIAVRYRATYDINKHDILRVEYLIVPCAILALIFNDEFTPFEVRHVLCGFRTLLSRRSRLGCGQRQRRVGQILWAFSIYLESVAIMPQLFMLQRSGEAETITAHYLFALGSYRGLYVLNWIHRYVYEGHVDYVAWVAGLVQTLLYADFFYIYITKCVPHGPGVKAT